VNPPVRVAVARTVPVAPRSFVSDGGVSASEKSGLAAAVTLIG
jgi:hypothetical protein